MVYISMKGSKYIKMKRAKKIFLRFTVSFLIRLIMLSLGYFKVTVTRINLGKSREIVAPMILSNHR